MFSLPSTVRNTLYKFSHQVIGSAPNHEERQALLDIGRKMSITYTDSEHEHMLKEIHSLSGIHTAYQRVGDCWTYLGFQRKDPVIDIRGGGVLALENLKYFLANHTSAAQAMILSRIGKGLTSQNTWESFPWAPAGINITRLLAGLFDIVEPSGRVKTVNFTRKTYYPLLLQHPDSFHRIYSIAFLLLDRIWDEMRATYMDFPRVLAALKVELEDYLMFSPSVESLESRVYARLGYSQCAGADVDIYSLPALPDECPQHVYKPSDRESSTDAQSEIFSMQSPHIPVKPTVAVIPDFLSADFTLDPLPFHMGNSPYNELAHCSYSCQPDASVPNFLCSEYSPPCSKSVVDMSESCTTKQHPNLRRRITREAYVLAAV